MGAAVRIASPRDIGPLASGWTVELDAIPHVPNASNGSTGTVNFSTLSNQSGLLPLNNSSVFTYDDGDAPDDLPPVTAVATSGQLGYGGAQYGTGGYGGQGSNGDQSGTTTYLPAAEVALTAQITGKIDTASVTNSVGSFTQGTGFTQFVTKDVSIPAVTSGSPVAAFNLAWQLAGNKPQSYTNTHGKYWSLRGHDCGFDYWNKQLVPTDESAFRLTAVGTTTFRSWDVRDSFTSTGWDVIDGEFWSTAGVASSVNVGAKQRTLIVGTVNLNNRSYVAQFGASNSGDFVGWGPDDAKNSTGKYFVLSLHGATSTGTLVGKYRSGGGYVSVSKTVSLSGIDMTSPVQFVVDVGFPSANSFLFTAYVQNVDSNDPPTTISTGTIPTSVDRYAAPWKSIGYLHGLFVTNESYSYDVTKLFGTYEEWSGGQPLCDVPLYGIDSPILPYTGSLWDYLTQVCLARQVGLRLTADQFDMSAMNEESVRANPWNPGAGVTVNVDNSTSAGTVEIDAQFTSFGKDALIYDAAIDNQVFSVTPGTTGVFSVTTKAINGLIYNPEPLYDFSDFLNNSHPYGAYIVTASDNLPIPVAEWISYGGSVSVVQTTPTTVEVTVVAPVIPLGADVTGDYSLSVSDSQTAHPMLRLYSPAGGAVVDNTVVFQTGSSFTDSNSAASTITNVAATNHRLLQNLATWAVATATGPNIVLSGSFPITDIRHWQGGDFGIVPGATLLYLNMQWRIVTATFSNVSVQFTATPFVTYQSTYWWLNWTGFTVDDYALFWDGFSYDDMSVAMLAGPNLNWDYGGAVSRYDLYPAGGSAAGDIGLQADPNLEPDPFLVPDAPFDGVTPGQSGVYPGGLNLFPGSEEDVGE